MCFIKLNELLIPWCVSIGGLSSNQNYMIMIDKQNEIADFLLSQFEDGCASKDDTLDAIMINTIMILRLIVSCRASKTRDCSMIGERLITN